MSMSEEERILPPGHRTPRSCPVCAQPVWLVGTEEGTNFYEGATSELLVERAEAAEARLARVPALVEVLREAVDWLDADLAANQDDHAATYSADRELIERWRETLAAFEAEQ